MRRSVLHEREQLTGDGYREPWQQGHCLVRAVNLLTRTLEQLGRHAEALEAIQDLEMLSLAPDVAIPADREELERRKRRLVERTAQGGIGGRREPGDSQSASRHTPSAER